MFFSLLLLLSFLILKTEGFYTSHMKLSSRVMQSSFNSGGINFKSEQLMNYFDLPAFFIVGASEDRNKFGNKVLRCMVAHKKLCIPLNKRLSEIEGIATVDSIDTLLQRMLLEHPEIPVSSIGMNIITPPSVTLPMIRQGYNLGMRNFFCQPGTVDTQVEDFIKLIDAVVIQDCVMVQLNEDHVS
mmetsp:Transcript_13584/g.13161  ORF Transcript_13584/g.13161 Transcript_13584/m.13161 type:complete len:185 (-) Transcript_13584:247-801(-)